MDEALERLKIWEDYMRMLHRRLLIVLSLLAVIGVSYGAYKYGYHRGASAAFEFMMQELSRQPMAKEQTL